MKLNFLRPPSAAESRTKCVAVEEAESNVNMRQGRTSGWPCWARQVQLEKVTMSLDFSDVQCGSQRSSPRGFMCERRHVR